MLNARHIYYKEYVKTRRALCVALVVMAAMTIYTFVDLNQTIRFNGMTALVAHILMRDARIGTQLRLLPSIVAVGIALVQFIPEMTNNRLKLTLHLPLPEGTIIRTMLFWGIAALTLIYALEYIAMSIGLSAYFAPQIVDAHMSDTLPWFIGGLTCYLLTAWIIIEPTWRQRICNCIISMPLALLFLQRTSCCGAYDNIMWLLWLTLLLTVVFPLHSACRFKRGAQ